MTEDWRTVPGYEGLYEVSDLGRVRSLRVREGRPFPYILNEQVNYKGYLRVCLSKDAKSKMWFVHLLVLLAFVGPKKPKVQTRHMDGDPTNNCLSNLRYGTARENTLDQVTHGTHQGARKTHCAHGHEYTQANTRLDRNGWRTCRACDTERRRKVQGGEGR